MAVSGIGWTTLVACGWALRKCSRVASLPRRRRRFRSPRTRATSPRGLGPPAQFTAVPASERWVRSMRLRPQVDERGASCRRRTVARPARDRRCDRAAIRWMREKSAPNAEIGDAAPSSWLRTSTQRPGSPSTGKAAMPSCAPGSKRPSDISRARAREHRIGKTGREVEQARPDRNEGPGPKRAVRPADADCRSRRRRGAAAQALQPQRLLRTG